MQPVATEIPGAVGWRHIACLQDTPIPARCSNDTHGFRMSKTNPMSTEVITPVPKAASIKTHAAPINN